MERGALVRASDADRERVAERLRAASIEGRLKPDELDERLHTALTARTYGELDAVVDDLPDDTQVALTGSARHSLAPLLAFGTLGLGALLALVSTLGRSAVGVAGGGSGPGGYPHTHGWLVRNPPFHHFAGFASGAATLAAMFFVGLLLVVVAGISWSLSDPNSAG